MAKLQLRTLPDEPYMHLLSSVSFEPVFVMGLARSGTTILYHMMTRSGCFNYVNLYHLLFFDQLISDHLQERSSLSKSRLNDMLRKEGVSDRQFDHVMIDADVVEEYGYVLGDRPRHRVLNDSKLPRFLSLARKIQFISDRTRPLLLKNPFDFTNFLYIARVFLNARFVFIHRHPLKTLNSQIRGIRNILSSRSPFLAIMSDAYRKITESPLLFGLNRLFWASRFGPGLFIITTTFIVLVKKYIRRIPLLDPRRYIEIRYEDLCLRPDETMRCILDFCDVRAPDVDYSGAIRPRKIEVETDVRVLAGAVYGCLEKYYRRFGYGVYPDEF